MPKQTFAAPWKALAERWDKLYTPPGRPSAEAIKFYKKFAKDATKGLRQKPRGLVFGATPELRDLLFELKFDVVMIDINLEMIEAMTELTKHKNQQEVIIKGDWVNNCLKSNYFDVVLGDLILGNVPWGLQDALLKSIKRVLKPGGAFITKIEFESDNWDKYLADSAAVLDMYAGFPRYKNKMMELFCYLMHVVCWDHKTHLSDLRKMRRWMGKYKKGNKYKHKNKEAERMLNALWAMWGPMDKIWALGTETEMKKKVQRFFQFKDVEVLSDCRLEIIDETFPMWYLQAHG